MTFFDAAVDRHLADIAQFVILGAGFDTRAFRLPKEGRVRSFEVDAPKTQAVKRETLEKAGIDSTGVTFVAADFEKEDWLTRLVDAGNREVGGACGIRGLRAKGDMPGPPLRC
jgi:methyltransferase (TIGR00027 family)